MSDCCTCRWCWVGRLKGQQYTSYCKSVRNKRGRPRTNPAPTDTPTVAKCQYCHTVPHHCSKKDRNNNLAAMVRDVSPDSQEKVVSQLLNGICEDKDVKQSLTSTELVTIWCWYQQIIRRKLSTLDHRKLNLNGQSRR